MLHHCKRKNDPRTMGGLKNEILMAIINNSGMKLDLAQRQLCCSPGELKSWKRIIRKGDYGSKA